MPTPPESPHDAMLRLIAGFRASRVVHVAARLRLADALRDGPKDAAALARITSAHAPSLERLLRALASLGLLAQDADGRFALTALGGTLDSDAPGSLRAWAELALGGEHYAAWGELEHSVRHGEVAFDRLYGTDVWTYRRQHAERSELFNQAMAALAGGLDPAIIGSAAFAGVQSLVDVGGGDGSLLVALLARHSAMRGVLFDLPHVVADARARIDRAGLAARCEVVAGDAFDSVPGGADGYVLCQVLHDWSDERAGAVLRSCRRAIAEGGRLVVIERVLPERFDPSPAARSAAMADLAMMVLTGGCERTVDDFRSLLESAGFRMGTVERSASGLALIGATPWQRPR
ncbi:MAG: methyltransferase [Candidatus Levyibacteriota bacterium]